MLIMKRKNYQHFINVIFLEFAGNIYLNTS